MANKRIPLTKASFKDKNRTREVYVPYIDVILTCNHRVSKPIKCYIDTGATINLFPMEVATTFLGYTEKSLKRKAYHIPIMGIGGIEIDGYGFKCSIHTLDFNIKNIYVFFVKDQPYPLLGRYGFMDKFKRITFDEENKEIELVM